ncbi:MAG: hypothetical protein HYX73_05050, partial [Acidobacteria bacterium]|nr:hypothetical protein [Acidobacteriota bacterium]
AETRDFFAEHLEGAPPEQRALAQEELLVAEGSDWCWWYGPEHSTANDADFDALYRTHLANVYRALGQRPPDTFSQPIARLRLDVISTPPSAALFPRIDGRVSSYFEWMGAGNYCPVTRATTMQGQPPILQEIFYGRNEDRLFLRIDFCKQPPESLEEISLRLGLRNTVRSADVTMTFSQDPESGGIHCHLDAQQEPGATTSLGQAVFKKILELELSLAALGIQHNQSLQFQVSVWQERLPLESLPLEGWLSVPVPA